LFAQGDYAMAIVDYNSEIKIDPKNPTTYKDRAAAYLRIGKIDKSRLDIAKVTELESYH